MGDPIPSPLSPEELEKPPLTDRDPAQMRAIVERFHNMPSTPDAIAEFCNLHKLPVITPGELEDWTFAYEHEQRIITIIPLVCAELAKFRYNRGLYTDAQMREISKENEKLTTRICEILEDNGVIYQEIELMTKTLGSTFQSALDSVGTRLENTSLRVMVEDAKEKYGVWLPIKVLAEEHRKRFRSKRTDA